MMKGILAKILGVCIIVASLGLTSCHDEPGEEKPVEKYRLILLYAVAANNLYSNLRADMNEILKVGNQLDLVHNKVLVYSVVPGGECKLQELVKGKNGYEYSTVRTFDSTPLSVEEERISEVIGYVEENYEYPYKGLILWSHATGWEPWFGSYPPRDERRRSFGADQYDGKTYRCNINDLAAAIPEGVFDFIWFDCCYMANIETVYQLRNKTEKIVGYVTEVWNDGMPYDATMPYLLRKNPDLPGAAFALYEHYDANWEAVTVSITDTSQLEQLAYTSSKIFSQGTPPSSLTGIHNYARSPQGPFYDMGQLLRSYTGVSTADLEEFNDTMDKAVPYKLASELDFTGAPIKAEDYCGLTMHNFVDNGSASENFYKELDWYVSTRVN